MFSTAVATPCREQHRPEEGVPRTIRDHRPTKKERA